MYGSFIYNPPDQQKPVKYGDWQKEQENKTVYVILASFCGGPASEIDQADNLDDLAEKLAKYRKSYNDAWRVWWKAVKQEVSG